MKKIAIRVSFVILFVVGMLLPNPGDGSIVSAIWGALWAIAFAVGIVYFTGSALVFGPVVVLMFSAVLPFVILCRIGLNAYGSWSASASEVVSHLRHDDPMGGLALFVPTIMAIIAVWFFGHMSLTSASRRPPTAAPDA
jgi:hypothetical protein